MSESNGSKTTVTARQIAAFFNFCAANDVTEAEAEALLADLDFRLAGVRSRVGLPSKEAFDRYVGCNRKH